MEVAPLDDPRPSQNTPASSAFPSATRKENSRSGERIYMRVPIVIYGFAAKLALPRRYQTVIVNPSGALVSLKTKLALGDIVFLIHKSSRQEQEVRVVYLDSYSDRETRVGLAFKKPSPTFGKRVARRLASPRLSASSSKVRTQRPSFCPERLHRRSQPGRRAFGRHRLPDSPPDHRSPPRWRKARFRVVWIGQVGSSESNQVGVFRCNRKKTSGASNSPKPPRLRKAQAPK